MTPRSHDILDALRDEARRLYVSIPLPPPGEDIPFPKLQELAQAFDRFLSAHELTGKTVARRLGKGFSEATISNFRRLAKVGDPAELPGHQFEKIARKIAAWMEEYHEQKSAVRPAEYVETQTAKLMLTAIKQAVRLRTMAAITSDSGRGKTLIAKAANSTFTGVYLRVLESHRGKSRFLLQLARALKLTTGRHLNAPDLHLRIIDQLEGSGRPIIIDEAHRLQIDALEVVRDIHDDCGCPVVLFGTRDLDRQVDDRDRFFGQLSRRITVRLDLNDWARDGGDEPVRPLFTVAEIQKIFETQGQVRLSSDGVATLYKIANSEGHGGMGLARTMFLIAAQAAKARSKPVTAALLMQVLYELRGKKRLVRQIENAMDHVPEFTNQKRAAG